MSKDKLISILVFNNFTNDSRVQKEANSLSKNGYNVQVIAHKDPTTLAEEKTENYNILRVSFLDRKTAGIISKIKAYLGFIKQSVRIAKQSTALHCNDLNTLPISFIIKTFYNRDIKVIYDAHEYETETNGLKGIKKQLTRIGEKLLIKHTDKIITVSESIAKAYSELYPKKATPSIVLNCPPYLASDKKDLFRTAFNIPKSATIFLYQGGLSKGRGIEVILDAFAKSNNPDNVIVFMGYGELQSHIEEKAKGKENIFIHEAVAPSVLLGYTSSADFGISTIENTCLSYYYCLPNKMFEYIMAEIPLIVSNLPEMEKIVTENKIGVVMKENSPNGLLTAIEEANSCNKEEMKQNLLGLKEIYNWEEQEKVLLETYNSVI